MVELKSAANEMSSVCLAAVDYSELEVAVLRGCFSEEVEVNFAFYYSKSVACWAVLRSMDSGLVPCSSYVLDSYFCHLNSCPG